MRDALMPIAGPGAEAANRASNSSVSATAEFCEIACVSYNSMRIPLLSPFVVTFVEDRACFVVTDVSVGNPNSLFSRIELK